MNVKLSIILITYNHSLYIRQAIESIFQQSFDGKIQLIIADDASIDDTLEIIKGYQNFDSRFDFLYLSKTKNLGITKNYQRAFQVCLGDYIAILEGDDFWIDGDKIEKQISILEKNKECVMCASNYFLYSENRGIYTTRTHNKEKEFMFYDVAFIIKDNLPGNFSSIMYRRDAVGKLPKEIFEFKSYDWIINIFLGIQGKFIYLYEPLSAYRIHEKGVWSSLNENERDFEQIKAILFCQSIMAKNTDQKFKNVIEILERKKLDIKNKKNSEKIKFKDVICRKIRNLFHIFFSE